MVTWVRIFAAEGSDVFEVKEDDPREVADISQVLDLACNLRDRYRKFMFLSKQFIQFITKHRTRTRVRSVF